MKLAHIFASVFVIILFFAIGKLLDQDLRSSLDQT